MVVVEVAGLLSIITGDLHTFFLNYRTCLFGTLQVVYSIAHK